MNACPIVTAPHESIMIGIQFLGPIHRPKPAEMGWKMTNVMKNREVA
jgi:hypothetical protein